MNTEQPSRIADQVLEKVRTGRVQMHSRAYFIARVALSVFVAFLTLGISSWVISFIFFSLHESGELFLLGYGVRGVQTFFALFPWLPLAFDVVLIVFLQWLLQGFKFGYRAALLTVFLYVLLGSVALAVLITLSPVHSNLLQRADRGELPLIGDMYEGIHDSHHDNGVFRGTVISSEGPTSTIMHNDGDHDSDDGVHEVITGPETDIDAALRPGDNVYIFGTENGTDIRADGIQHVQDRR